MVLRTIGPRITGPWDLGCLGSKVRGPKVRGSKALGLIILEPLETYDTLFEQGLVFLLMITISEFR